MGEGADAARLAETLRPPSGRLPKKATSFVNSSQKRKVAVTRPLHKIWSAAVSRAAGSDAWQALVARASRGVWQARQEGLASHAQGQRARGEGCGGRGAGGA